MLALDLSLKKYSLTTNSVKMLLISQSDTSTEARGSGETLGLLGQAAGKRCGWCRSLEEGSRGAHGLRAKQQGRRYAADQHTEPFTELTAKARDTLRADSAPVKFILLASSSHFPPIFLQ